MQAGVLMFDPSNDPCSVIGKQCGGFGRSQRWCILEWARMNPGRFKGFFARMIRDVEFRLFYNSMYDCLRLSFQRIFDEPAFRVVKIEQGLNRSVLNILAQET